MECLLTLEDQVGVSWTGVASEKRLHWTTNFEGNEERREEVSPHGCSTGLFAFVMMFSLGNLVSFDLVLQMAQGFPQRRQGADLVITFATILVG